MIANENNQKLNSKKIFNIFIHRYMTIYEVNCKKIYRPGERLIKFNSESKERNFSTLQYKTLLKKLNEYVNEFDNNEDTKYKIKKPKIK